MEQQQNAAGHCRVRPRLRADFLAQLVERDVDWFADRLLEALDERLAVAAEQRGHRQRLDRVGAQCVRVPAEVRARRVVPLALATVQQHRDVLPVADCVQHVEDGARFRSDGVLDDDERVPPGAVE
ncbi:MAG: hypothetical protein ABEH83_13275 [Halobacterium sp.]